MWVHGRNGFAGDRLEVQAYEVGGIDVRRHADQLGLGEVARA